MKVETLLELAPEFPMRLRVGAHTPKQLFVKGSLALLGARSIAIVGSREATPEAIWFAECLGRSAGRAGLVVVSGAARGIDTAVHGGAVAVGGRAIAVLGRPLDAPVPQRTRALLHEAIDIGGAVVSERPQGTGFHRVHYIQRNRIIAGLAEVTLVVSAKERSGALSTALWAQRFSRELWAVPGAPWEVRAAGSNQLIVDGARPIPTLQAFEEAIHAHFGVAVGARSVRAGLLACLVNGPRSQDELGRALQQDPATLAHELIGHQLEGRICRTQDGRYALRM
jgi:DNA processing protein